MHVRKRILKHTKSTRKFREARAQLVRCPFLALLSTQKAELWSSH